MLSIARTFVMSCSFISHNHLLVLVDNVVTSARTCTWWKDHYLMFSEDQPFTHSNLLLNRPIVHWWDNFGAKAYHIAIQGIATGSFKLPLWTGQGFHEYVGDRDIDMTVHPDLPGMPDTLFTDDVCDEIKSYLGVADRIGCDYYEDSLVRKYDVRRVPVKPQVSEVDNPELHKVLAEARDGLVDFYPTGLKQENIGSNRGLFLLLKDLKDQRDNSAHSEYHVLNTDCNIFMRSLKV